MKIIKSQIYHIFLDLFGPQVFSQFDQKNVISTPFSLFLSNHKNIAKNGFIGPKLVNFRILVLNGCEKL